MKSPLRYCARKEKGEGGSSSFIVKIDEGAETLTSIVETSVPDRDEGSYSCYSARLSDIDPNLIRFTPIGADPVSWMNLVCRDYLDAVTVDRRFSGSESVTLRQCYLPIPIARPLLRRPNILEDFQAWITPHFNNGSTAAVALATETAEKIASLLEPANGVLVPSNSGNREFTQEVRFLRRELIIERQMATPKKFHGRWRFPVLALDSDPPLLERLGDLAMLKLNSRFPLAECEWYMGYGNPTEERQIAIVFRSESEASELGDFLHSTIARFRTQKMTP